MSPDAPGGIETFLAQLVVALERHGCRSTLLASGDSSVGSVIPVVPVCLRDQMRVGGASEYVYYEQHQLRVAIQVGAEFDVVHSHIGPGGYVLSSVLPHVLHTQHTPVYDDLTWFASQHSDLWFSTVSHLQAGKLRRVSRCETIHNGVDMRSSAASVAPGSGLCFVGRIEAEKGPDLAIDVAEALALPLTIAGPIVDQAFFETAIEPRLTPHVRYAGVLDHRSKNDLLARSACAVLPFRGDESFGMVVVEAMACGTPVVALANGAAPELIESGVTGWLAAGQEDLAGAVMRAMEMDRSAVRVRAEERFDIGVVGAQYVRLYERIAPQG